MNYCLFIPVVKPHPSALTCILDQGAEVVVMPREVWKELGVPLRSDHSLNMEPVNMTCNSTLGMIENVLLDFGMV